MAPPRATRKRAAAAAPMEDAAASKQQQRAARFVKGLAQSLTAQDTGVGLSREALAAALGAAVGRLPHGPSRTSLEAEKERWAEELFTLLQTSGKIPAASPAKQAKRAQPSAAKLGAAALLAAAESAVAAAAGCCASTPLGEKKPNSLVAAAHAVTAAVEAAEGEAAHAARVAVLVRKLAAVAAVQRRSGHADMASAATAVAQLHKNKGGAHVTAAAVLGDQRHALLKLLLSSNETDATLCDAALSRSWAAALPAQHHHQEEEGGEMLARIQLVRRVRVTQGTSSRAALRALASLQVNRAPAALAACMPSAAAAAAPSAAATAMWLATTATDDQVASAATKWAAIQRAAAAAAAAPAALASSVLAERTLHAEEDDSLFYTDTLGDTAAAFVDEDSD